MKNCNLLPDVLNTLMYQRGYRNLSALAKATGIPQPTLHQLMSGTTHKPRSKTLETLAEHFQVSSAALLGNTPLPLYLPHALNLPSVPILTWEDLSSWPHEAHPMARKQLLLEHPLSPSSFAIHMRGSSMEPLIPDGSLLIFDPEKPLKDKCCVIVYFNAYRDFFVKYTLIEGSCIYLKPFNPTLKDVATIRLGPEDRILAGLVEVRIKTR